MARYTEGALYTLWRQGVSVVTWWLMRDEPEGQGWGYTLQAGVFFRGATVADDRPKPGFYAFRFPFTAYTKRGVAQVWGLAPNSGGVTIQARKGGRWRTIARLRTRPGRMFFARCDWPRHAAAGAPGRRDEPGVARGAERDGVAALASPAEADRAGPELHAPGAVLRACVDADQAPAGGDPDPEDAPPGAVGERAPPDGYRPGRACACGRRPAP